MNFKNRFTLTTVAGLFTGNLPGLLLSPMCLYLLEKRNFSGAKKWAAWGLAGVVIAPISNASVMAALGTKSAPKPAEVAEVSPTPVAAEQVAPTEEPVDAPMAVTESKTVAPQPTVQPAALQEPAEVAAPVEKSPKQQFADTLVSSTEGLFAQEAMGLLGPNMYETRHDLWRAIDGASIDEAEYVVAQALQSIAYTHNLSWDDKQIANMSGGVVKGLYRWNNENPGDLQ